MTITRISKSEKIKFVEGLMRVSGDSANRIQLSLKGTPYSMRRQELLKLSKNIRQSDPIKTIKADKGMSPETKKKLIKVIKSNFKKGEHMKTMDMMRTIYNPDNGGEHYV